MEIRIFFVTFALVILWIADNELLAQNLPFGSILWKWRLLRFSSDVLEIRDFQKNLRKEQGGRLHLACIYMAQVRPFVKRGCILCYPYIPHLA